MPNYIKVTTVDANHIKVEFQDYYPATVSISTSFYSRSDVLKVEVFANCVAVTMENAEVWYLNSVANGSILQIDDIDGTTTWASLTVLAAQLAALIKL